MSNPIFHFSTLTEDGHDGNHTGPSHAIHQNSERTLCGIGPQELDCALWGRLSELDGVVTCEACMSELVKHNVAGMYAGPRAFVTEAIAVDGVVLDNFGWGVFDDSYEHFFAYGFHAPGTVLEIGRKLSQNSLTCWGELQTTIFAHWSMPLEGSQGDTPYCWLAWRKTAESDLTHPSLMVIPHEVTVLRHNAWPILAEQGMETEHSCRRLRDWYSSSTKLGRPATLDDFDPADAPGYTLRGIPKGASESTCLEWPTSDFEEALSQMSKWSLACATDLEISGESVCLSKQQLEAGAAQIIRHGIKHHGRDVAFHNFLEWYQLKNH